MTRLLTAAFGLAVALPLVSAAPVPTHVMPKDPLPYFPTKVGARWVYEDGGKCTFVVTKVVAKDGAAVVTVETGRDDGGTQSYQKVEVSRKGLVEVENFGRKCDPPVPLLRLPHVPGDKWESAFTLDGEKRGTYSMTAGEVEEVKVPAGTFRAVRVDTVTSDGNRFTHWYVAGIGPVRLKYAQFSRDLVSFTPGKD